MELIDKKINDALNKELEATEGSTNNLYKRLTDEKTCAIISPYRGENSDKENKQKMALLKSEVIHPIFILERNLVDKVNILKVVFFLRNHFILGIKHTLVPLII